MDVDSLYPEIARNGRDAVKALEDSKLEAQDALAKANRQLANLVDALAENPAQPTIQSRLNTTQATADNLTVTIQNIDSQIAEARERVETNDLSAVQDAIARMGENLRANNNDRYDLRSRLHQLFKRTLDKIVLTTGTKHQRTIAAHFQGSEKVRTVEVEF